MCHKYMYTKKLNLFVYLWIYAAPRCTIAIPTQFLIAYSVQKWKRKAWSILSSESSHVYLGTWIWSVLDLILSPFFSHGVCPRAKWCQDLQ